jgi:phage tail-like protein
MRFKVEVTTLAPNATPDPFTDLGTAAGTGGAGFSAVTTPEETMEAVEYREGTYVYTRKYPGIPSQADITMSRGVTAHDSSFFAWMLRTTRGGGEYRVDLSIKHFTRETMIGNSGEIDVSSGAIRKYDIKDAFCIRHKVAGDLDGTASEVSIMELDAGYEFFNVTLENPSVPLAPDTTSLAP